MSVVLARFSEPCLPPLWAKGGHRQTLLGHILPSRGARIVGGEGSWSRFAIDTTDGERLCAFHHPGTSGIRVHLFHGLSGDVNSDYMRRTAAALLEDGHEIWAINHRGCGAGEGLAKEPYHSGKVEDLQAVLQASESEPGADARVVLGFSLSGNLGLLYAARGLKPAPDGLIAVCPPVDLLRTSTDIGRGFNRIYEVRFLHRLVRKVREGQRTGVYSASRRVSRWSSLIEFDDHFTAPVCGFASGRDYYERCSTRPHLSKIRVPTVILSSEDDPFVNPAGYGDFAGSTEVLWHREKWGGHVGFVDSKSGPGERWLDRSLRHYVCAFRGVKLRL